MSKKYYRILGQATKSFKKNFNSLRASFASVAHVTRRGPKDKPYDVPVARARMARRVETFETSIRIGLLKWAKDHGH